MLMLDAERRMHGFTKFQRHKKKNPGSQDYAVFLSFLKKKKIFQEADEHCLCGHEPIPHEANPQSARLPPGESPSRADGAGSDPTDLPQGARDEAG